MLVVSIEGPRRMMPSITPCIQPICDTRRARSLALSYRYRFNDVMELGACKDTQDCHALHRCVVLCTGVSCSVCRACPVRSPLPTHQAKSQHGQ